MSHLSREQHPQWRGGRHIDLDGYVRVLLGKGHPRADSKGYAHEHVVVAEETLGRRLAPGEVVHHKNGVKTDNRPENLQVMTQSEHLRLEHQINPRMHRFPSGPQPKKDICAHGHPYTPESTYIQSRNGKTWRNCRVCHREQERERRQRQLEQRGA